MTEWWCQLPSLTTWFCTAFMTSPRLLKDIVPVETFRLVAAMALRIASGSVEPERFSASAATRIAVWAEAALPTVLEALEYSETPDGLRTPSQA